MLIKSFCLGHIRTNCYIVTDETTLECVVIDPGSESNTVLSYLEDNRLTCKYILLTHGHFDHTGAVNDIQKATSAPLGMSKGEVRKSIAEMGLRFAHSKDTVFLKEGDTVTVGSLDFHVIETPGHSQGGLTYRCGTALFTGDTLFKDSCGRTDLPGCDGEKMMASLKKLYELPGDYEVYPGHMEATSLDRERRFNYFMQSAVQG